MYLFQNMTNLNFLIGNHVYTPVQVPNLILSNFHLHKIRNLNFLYIILEMFFCIIWAYNAVFFGYPTIAEKKNCLNPKMETVVWPMKFLLLLKNRSVCSLTLASCIQRMASENSQDIDRSRVCKNNLSGF